MRLNTQMQESLVKPLSLTGSINTLSLWKAVSRKPPEQELFTEGVSNERCPTGPPPPHTMPPSLYHLQIY